MDFDCRASRGRISGRMVAQAALGPKPQLECRDPDSGHTLIDWIMPSDDWGAVGEPCVVAEYLAQGDVR